MLLAAAISCFPYAVHDAFNWLTVLILLPIEVATGYLYYMTAAMVHGIEHNNDNENPMFLKVITEPLTKSIMQVSTSLEFFEHKGRRRRLHMIKSKTVFNLGLHNILCH